MSIETPAHESTEAVEHFDVLVLGSGEAGKYIAWGTGAAGKKTALIERRYVGGSCPNVACLPSKNFVHSAKVAHYASQAAAFGLPQATGGVDMEVVRGRKRTMVDALVEIHEGRFAKAGVELLLGSGRFIAPKTIQVAMNDGSSRTFSGETVIISTGSRATVDPIPGMLEAAPLTHVEMLEIGEVPAHLIILGGGYIGLEFAQAMRRLGSAVTIIERSGRLLSREDVDVSETLMGVLASEGVESLVNTTVQQVSGRSGSSVTIHGTRAGEPFELTGTHILIATGRTPNTDGIGLDLAGVALTERGFVQVDEYLRTTAEGVFAVGDCAGSPQFTHIAYDDSRIVKAALTGGSRSTTGRQVPSCLFTDPEFAKIGLGESEAKRKGIAYRLAKLPMAAVLRTRTMGETTGFLKALIGAENDLILGFTAVGFGAGEMLAAVQLAMSVALPYTSLRDLIVTHPTLNEGLVYLFASPLELKAAVS